MKRVDESDEMPDGRNARTRGRRLRATGVIIALGAVLALAGTSCTHMAKDPIGDMIGRTLERDGLLPEGTSWRSSPSVQYLCIFGAPDSATQDLVVERVRDVLRRRAKSAFGIVTVEFWSGEPPPEGVGVSIKEQRAPMPGEPPPNEVAARNARYGISLVRSVRIESPLDELTR